MSEASEAERSGISLAELQHITQGKTSFSIAKLLLKPFAIHSPFSLLVVYGYGSSTDPNVTYKHIKKHMGTTHAVF